MLQIYLIWNNFGISFPCIFYSNVIDYILNDQEDVDVTFTA